MYTKSFAFLTPRRLQTLLWTNEYIFQFRSHDDAEHVNEIIRFAIKGNALPPTRVLYLDGRRVFLADRTGGQTIGPDGPDKDSNGGWNSLSLFLFVL